jgi:hypothetical protein
MVRMIVTSMYMGVALASDDRGIISAENVRRGRYEHTVRVELQ